MSTTGHGLSGNEHPLHGMMAGKSIQSQGGKARAASMTPEQRSQVSRDAATARWSKHDHELEAFMKVVSILSKQSNETRVKIIKTAAIFFGIKL